MSFAGDKVSRLAKRAENAYYQRDREEILRVCEAYEQEIDVLRLRIILLEANQASTNPHQEL